MSDPTWVTARSAEARAAGDGARCGRFIESMCRVTKDSIGGRAGSLIRLRSWQQDILDDLLARDPATGLYVSRESLVGIPRKNAKTTLFSGVALWSLVEGPIGGEVYAVAGTKLQAGILFGVAKRMVELEPQLADDLVIYKDAIEYPPIGSVFRVLSAEAGYQEGLLTRT